MFKVDRADDCIWLVDPRNDEPVTLHFTPCQAEAIGKELQQAGKAGNEYHGQVPVQAPRSPQSV